MKTKLNELLEFLLLLLTKLWGRRYLSWLIRWLKWYSAMRRDYTPTVKPSSKGNYHSVSITINATHIEQVETLYEELGKIDIVRMVL